MKTIQESAVDLREHLKTLNNYSLIDVKVKRDELSLIVLVYATQQKILCPAIYDGWKVINK